MSFLQYNLIYVIKSIRPLVFWKIIVFDFGDKLHYNQRPVVAQEHKVVTVNWEAVYTDCGFDSHSGKYWIF